LRNIFLADAYLREKKLQNFLKNLLIHYENIFFIMISIKAIDFC